jgi:hypothetical protein
MSEWGRGDGPSGEAEDGVRNGEPRRAASCLCSRMCASFWSTGAAKLASCSRGPARGRVDRKAQDSSTAGNRPGRISRPKPYREIRVPRVRQRYTDFPVLRRSPSAATILSRTENALRKLRAGISRAFSVRHSCFCPRAGNAHDQETQLPPMQKHRDLSFAPARYS